MPLLRQPIVLFSQPVMECTRQNLPQRTGTGNSMYAVLSLQRLRIETPGCFRLNAVGGTLLGVEPSSIAPLVPASNPPPYLSRLPLLPLETYEKQFLLRNSASWQSHNLLIGACKYCKLLLISHQGGHVPSLAQIVVNGCFFNFLPKQSLEYNMAFPDRIPNSVLCFTIFVYIVGYILQLPFFVFLLNIGSKMPLETLQSHRQL